MRVTLMKMTGKEYNIILSELENYNPILLKKPRIIALNNWITFPPSAS